MDTLVDGTVANSYGGPANKTTFNEVRTFARSIYMLCAWDENWTHSSHYFPSSHISIASMRKLSFSNVVLGHLFVDYTECSGDASLPGRGNSL